ncbi:MAG: YdeI/OmpD-associated family protein [Burkholderiales bacterium]
MSKRKSFRATLERDGSRLNWVIIRVPFDVAKVWGTRGRLKAKGDIGGFAFRTSLFPDGKGGHAMIVNKRMQASAGVVPGNTAQFHLEPDTAERTVTPPPELKRLLSQDRSFHRWYDALNYSTRKDIADWITGVKSPEARMRRADQIAERLMATMEAERELPPILRIAFANNARAREGWELMSVSHRRGHLMGIFYYRTPQARARRVEKMIDDALAIAERRKSGVS